MFKVRNYTAWIAAALLLVSATSVRAEVVDEIVAWVNGDIITLSDLLEEERVMTAEAFRRFTGDELDRYLEGVRSGLLLTLIDNKILVHRARTLFNLDNMSKSLYENFKQQQNLTSDEELKALLDQEGITVEGLNERLLSMYAPDEVIRLEVGGRIAVGEREIQEYYDANPASFLIPGSVYVQEIVLLAEDEETKKVRRADARKIHERAKKGEDFGALATEVSEAGTASKGGQLGPLQEGDLNKKLESVAFTVPVGEISELLEMPYGFHIVKVVSREEAVIEPIEKVHDMLRDSLEEEHYVEQRKSYMNRTRNDAEWCVKEKFKDRLAVESPECPSL